jgi:hypothetical protein
LRGALYFHFYLDHRGWLETRIVQPVVVSTVVAALSIDEPVAASATRAVRSARLALAAFVAYVVVAWPVLVFGMGSQRWFRDDELRIFAGRDGGDIGDIFRAHDVHPIALPVVVFRLMFNVFGLWFTPYLMLVVTMHLGVAMMLRVVIRRAGVGPWIATAAAGSLVLFGPGEENILWAFQITLLSSILLGLTQLVLADHDGPLTRRDALGVIAGVGAVMSSGIGPLMVVAVGLAALARRGWRIALFHVAPPALAYVAWTAVEDPAGYAFGRPALSVVWDWIRVGQDATVQAVGGTTVVALVLTALLVAGLWQLARSSTIDDLRRRASVPVALLACGPVLFALTAQVRWGFGLEEARASRYVYIGAVLLLPALALAGDAIARRWRSAMVPVVALLLVSVPGNISDFNSSTFDARYFDAQRQTVLGLARTDLAERVPRSVRPLHDPFSADEVTIGWLLDLRDEGRLPDAGAIDPRVEALFPLRLGLAQVDGPLVAPCTTRTAPVDLSLNEGDRLAIRTPALIGLLESGAVASRPMYFGPRDQGTISVELPLSVRISPIKPGAKLTMCR